MDIDMQPADLHRLKQICLWTLYTNTI